MADFERISGSVGNALERARLGDAKTGPPPYDPEALTREAASLHFMEAFRTTGDTRKIYATISGDRVRLHDTQSFIDIFGTIDAIRTGGDPEAIVPTPIAVQYRGVYRPRGYGELLEDFDKNFPNLYGKTREISHQRAAARQEGLPEKPVPELTDEEKLAKDRDDHYVSSAYVAMAGHSRMQDQHYYLPYLYRIG